MRYIVFIQLSILWGYLFLQHTHGLVDWSINLSVSSHLSVVSSILSLGRAKKSLTLVQWKKDKQHHNDELIDTIYSWELDQDFSSKFQVCIYSNLSSRAGCDTSSIFWNKAGWIQCFSSPELVAWPRLKNIALLFIPSWEKKWIHAFLSSITPKLNANSIIQDLNSGQQFHFLWQ